MAFIGSIWLDFSKRIVELGEGVAIKVAIDGWFSLELTILNSEYTTRVKNSISEENWRMLKQYKTGLYYVLDKFPEIAQYMSERYLSSSIPLTLVVAEHYEPTQEIGETEQDMLKWKECLKNLGNLPNHRYVTTQDTDHKVWEKDPKTVIDEIARLYNQTKDIKPNR